MNALIKFTGQMRSVTDKTEKGCAFFVDLKNAFDTINYERLLKIRNTFLSVSENYLQRSKQFVVTNNSQSKILQTHYGVPQVSVLGPLLFLLYTNDLPENGKEIQTVLFVDALLNTVP